MEVKSQTGWSWLPGNCFVQTYELNEENEHELTDGDGGTGTFSTPKFGGLFFINVSHPSLKNSNQNFSDQCNNNV